MEWHARTWAVTGALLAGILALFLPAFLHPDALLYPTFSPHSDLTVIHWPKVHLMAESWRSEGHLPLWTSANLSGMPLAANQLAMRFYPPAWMLLLVPSGVGFNLFLIAHLCWAGIGTGWLLRRAFQLDLLPALIGSFTFALGGKLVAHMAGGHISLIAAAAWIPWAFGAISLFLRAESATERLRHALLASLALAAQICTHSLILLYTSYLLVGRILWELIFPEYPRTVRTFSLLPLLSIIPLGASIMGAAQLLPLVELASYSNRALSIEEAGQYALMPLPLGVALFLPQSYAGHEAVAYLGLLPIVLAGWGLRRDDRRTWFLALVVLMALLFALGNATPLFELVYRLAPGMRYVRTPARVLIVASLALAILAGLGAQRLAGRRVPWHDGVVLAMAAITTASGIGLAILQRADRATLGLALMPFAALLVIGLVARQHLHRRAAWLILACLTWVDLGSFGFTLIRFVPPQDAFAAGARAAEYLSQQHGLWRSYSPSYSIPPHVAAKMGIQTADGVEPVHLGRYDRFMELAGNYAGLSDVPVGRFSVTIPPFPSDRPIERAFEGVQPNLSLLGLMNVAYVVTAFPLPMDDLDLLIQIDNTFIYRNRRVLPRAWLLPAEVAESFLTMGEPVEWLQLLEALYKQAALQRDTASDQVLIREYRADRIVLDVSTPERSLLVLSENWYPGWQAQVDDVPALVVPVADLLRGVWLEAGNHHVVLTYQSLTVRIGMAISATAATGLLLFVGLTLACRATRC